jgi:hypothetical protein
MATLPAKALPGSYTWTFPGCPIEIHLRISMVEALQKRLENPDDSRNFASRGGLLIGRPLRPGVIEVTGFDLLASLNPSTVEAALSRAPGHVAGFFRTTRGGDLQMTRDDVSLASALFPSPESVVLLIETGEPGPANACFFFWDNGRMLADMAVMEFPFAAGQLAAAEVQRRFHREASHPVTAPEADPRLQPAASPKRNRDWRPWIAAAMLAVFTSAWLSYPKRKPDPPQVAAPSTAASAVTMPLGLFAERQESGLRLSWNPAAPGIQRAAYGVLMAREDDQTRMIPLAPEQLRSGKLTFKPHADRVDFELDTVAGDQVTKESVTVLLPERH